MHYVGWSPDQQYISSDSQTLGHPEDPPPYPFHEMSWAPPYCPLLDPGRPDLAYGPHVLPFFGGFQPQPPPASTPSAPPPPAPASTPAPAAAAAAAPAPRGAIPSAHVDASAAGVVDGVSYLYPAKHTSLHIIMGTVIPYDTPETAFPFAIVRAPCSMTVGELLQRISPPEGDANNNNNKMGLTECLELGSGAWAKGLTVFKGDNAAKLSLDKIGWDEDRGKRNPPVWLVWTKKD